MGENGKETKSSTATGRPQAKCKAQSDLRETSQQKARTKKFYLVFPFYGDYFESGQACLYVDVAVFWVCGWLGLAFYPRTPFPLLPYRAAAAPDKSACDRLSHLSNDSTLWLENVIFPWQIYANIRNISLSGGGADLSLLEK